MLSTLWAGPAMLSRAMVRGERPVEGQASHKPVSLKLGFEGEDYGYAIDLGPPVISDTMFSPDPKIKGEAI